MWTLLITLSAIFATSYALECYQCDELDWNHQDCTHKRQGCDPFQDACTTYIRYAVPQSFDKRGYRRYYISKGCDTRSGCEKRQAGMQTACQRDYFNDWACVECCVGDLCNYYVAHLGAGSIKANVVMTTMVATAAGLLLKWR